MSSELKLEHVDMVNEYLQKTKNNSQDVYMLTIARDGEYPVRSILFFGNVVDAVEGFNKYKDWGFAKNYLTVSLYEPNGKINTKVLKRNQAGESTFIKNDYIEISNILKSFKDKINYVFYKDLCIRIMTVFSKDNWRFDPERFLKDLGIEEKMPN